MYCNLYGMPMESTIRRTIPRKHYNKGICGVPIASAGVIENNGRGYNHHHGLFWAEIPAWALERILGVPSLHNALGQYIDSCVSGEKLTFYNKYSLQQSFTFALDLYP
jgi:hypothetical protein